MSVSVDKEKCNGCGLCVSTCPVQAISLIQNKASIDQNKCNECLLCMDECPTYAIHQIPEKEVYLEKREPPVPESLKRTVPHTEHKFSSIEPIFPAERKSGIFLNGVKKVMDSFFKIDSPLGRGRKGGRIRQQRQRKRHRGGRF